MYLNLSYKGKITQVLKTKVIFCKAEKQYTRFVMEDNQHILSSCNIKNTEEILRSDSFFRIHNSYLVNLQHVSTCHNCKEGGRTILSNSEELPVARRRKAKFIRAIRNFSKPILSKTRPD